MIKRNPYEVRDRWQTICGYWQVWVKNNFWENLNTVLREQVRAAEGREVQPSACIMDSQSPRTHGLPLRLPGFTSMI